VASPAGGTLSFSLAVRGTRLGEKGKKGVNIRGKKGGRENDYRIDLGESFNRIERREGEWEGERSRTHMQLIKPNIEERRGALPNPWLAVNALYSIFSGQGSSSGGEKGGEKSAIVSTISRPRDQEGGGRRKEESV